MNMVWLFKLLYEDEEAQGLLEYGLIISLIAVLLVFSVQTFGLQVNEIYEQIVAKIP